MGSKIFNLVLLIVGVISAFAFMKMTYDGFHNKFIQKYFSLNKLDTDDAKLTLFLKFGLYFAIYSIILKITGWILSRFERFKQQAATVERILLNSYDYFIIVFLILFYLIQNKTGKLLINKDWNMKKKIPLFGFWFIFGRILFAIGYLLTTLTGLNFKVIGVAMTYFLIALMMGEALNFNPFRAFTFLGSLNGDL